MTVFAVAVLAELAVGKAFAVEFETLRLCTFARLAITLCLFSTTK